MKTTIFMLLVLFLVVSPAVAQMYEWVDEKGVVNFTDNPVHIPDKYKGKAKKLENMLPTETEKAPAAPPAAEPQRVRTMRSNDEPLYANRPLSWWKSEYDSRKLALENMRNELEKLKEADNVARRKKMIYQRRSDYRALDESKNKIAMQEELIRNAERSLAEFEKYADQAGLPVDWRK